MKCFHAKVPAVAVLLCALALVFALSLAACQNSVSNDADERSEETGTGSVSFAIDTETVDGRRYVTAWRDADGRAVGRPSRCPARRSWCGGRS